MMDFTLERIKSVHVIFAYSYSFNYIESLEFALETLFRVDSSLNFLLKS